MPLFAFITGYFTKNTEKARNFAIEKMFDSVCIIAISICNNRKNDDLYGIS